MTVQPAPPSRPATPFRPWTTLAGAIRRLRAPIAPPPGLSEPPDAPLEPGRGREAEAPTEIPAVGWKDVLWRTAREYGEDNISAVAGGIAFCGVTAIFPAMAAFVSLYGLFADVTTARDHLAVLTGIVPADALTLIGDQMVRIADQASGSLSLTFVFTLLLSVWSANAGMKALFAGLNVAYDEREKRGFVKFNLITLAFTLGMVLFMALAAAAVVALPVVMSFLRIDPALAALSMLRWPLLLAMTMLGLSVIYRFGPSRAKAKWRWVSVGGAVGAVLWLLGSLIFSWYLANFANYNATYGSLGAVFGFLSWIWLSSVIVLLGAELNAEIEHQTAVDSTTGPAAPMGERGAAMADTVGKAKHGGWSGLLPDAVARRLPKRSKAA